MVGAVERRPPVADQTLFNVTMALLVVGIVAVYDSSYARSMDAGIDGFFYLKKQAIYAAIGIGGVGPPVRSGGWEPRRGGGGFSTASTAFCLSVEFANIGIPPKAACPLRGLGE